MVSTTLTARSPLDGYSGTFDTTCIREICPLAIMSVTIPRQGMDSLEQRFQALWQTPFPKAGQCIRIRNVKLADISATLALMGLQSDQCFLVIEAANGDTQSVFAHLETVLDSVAYLTDQTDSLAVLDVEGPLTMSAMERICMLDLDSFETSTVARTTMEHLSVIIEKPDHDRVRLYSPRSTASSFLHTVTTSLQNVTENQNGHGMPAPGHKRPTPDRRSFNLTPDK